MIICAPCLVLVLVKIKKRREKKAREEERLLNGLVKIAFDPEVHADEECAICMILFAKGEELTILPCHARHHFHSSCILEWLKLPKKRICPLDRQAIT